MLLKAKKLEPPQSLYLILGALDGPALDMCRDLSEKVSNYKTNEEFFEVLKEKFVSPAHTSIAKVNFERRCQEPKEDIKIYHGLLRSLYNDAYEVKERRENVLIERFLLGIRDKSLRQRVSELRIVNQLPTDYDGVLNKALQYLAERERFSTMENFQRRFTNPNHPQQHHGSNSMEEPMEIGSCRLHKGAKHSDSECYSQKKKSNNSNSNYSNNNNNNSNHNSNPGRKQGVAGNGKCFKCGKEGHFAKSCKNQENPRGGAQQ